MIRLICLDLDGVLVERKNFWLELHKRFGTLDEGARLSKELAHDRGQLVRSVVQRLWAGRDAAVYQELVDSYEPLPGIDALFAELDLFLGENGERLPRAIVTGGCYDVAQRIAGRYGIDYLFANQLIAKDGVISEEFHWPVGGVYSRRQVVEQLCDDFHILPQEVLVIGGSNGDVDLFRIAGISIAFNAAAKELRAAATYVVDAKNLGDLVPILRRLRESTEQSAAGAPKI